MAPVSIAPRLWGTPSACACPESARGSGARARTQASSRAGEAAAWSIARGRGRARALQVRARAVAARVRARRLRAAFCMGVSPLWALGDAVVAAAARARAGAAACSDVRVCSGLRAVAVFRGAAAGQPWCAGRRGCRPLFRRRRRRLRSGRCKPALVLRAVLEGRAAPARAGGARGGGFTRRLSLQVPGTAWGGGRTGSWATAGTVRACVCVCVGGARGVRALAWFRRCVRGARRR